MFRVRVQNHEGLIEKRLYGYIRARAVTNQCDTRVRGWIRHSFISYNKEPILSYAMSLTQSHTHLTTNSFQSPNHNPITVATAHRYLQHESLYLLANHVRLT